MRIFHAKPKSINTKLQRSFAPLRGKMIGIEQDVEECDATDAK